MSEPLDDGSTPDKGKVLATKMLLKIALQMVGETGREVCDYTPYEYPSGVFYVENDVDDDGIGKDSPGDDDLVPSGVEVDYIHKDYTHAPDEIVSPKVDLTKMPEAAEPWDGESHPVGRGGRSQPSGEAMEMVGQYLSEVVIDLLKDWARANRDYLDEPGWFDRTMDVEYSVEWDKARARCKKCCEDVGKLCEKTSKRMRDEIPKQGIQTTDNAKRARRNRKSRAN